MKHLPKIIQHFNLSVCFLSLYVLSSMYEMLGLVGVRDFQEVSNYSFPCALSLFLLLVWWFFGFWKDHFLTLHFIISWSLLVSAAVCYYFSLLAYESTILGFFNSLYVRPPAPDPFTGIFVVFFGFVCWACTLWFKRHSFGLVAMFAFLSWVYVFWGLLSIPCLLWTLFLIWFVGTNYYYYRIYDPFFFTRYRRRLKWMEKKLQIKLQIYFFFIRSPQARAQFFEQSVWTLATENEERRLFWIALNRLCWAVDHEEICIPEVLKHFWYHFDEETDFDVIFDPIQEHEINRRPLFDRAYWGFAKKGDDEEDEPSAEGIF